MLESEEHQISVIGMEEITKNDIEVTTRDLELLSLEDGQNPPRIEISVEKVRNCIYSLPDEELRDSADALGLFESLLTIEVHLNEDIGLTPENIRHVLPCRYTVDQVKSFIFRKTSSLRNLSQNDYVLGLSPEEKLNIEFIKFLRASSSIPELVGNQKIIPLYLYSKFPNSDKKKRTLSNRRSISNNRITLIDHSKTPSFQKTSTDTSLGAPKTELSTNLNSNISDLYSSTPINLTKVTNSSQASIPTARPSAMSKKLMVKELTLPVLSSPMSDNTNNSQPPTLRRNTPLHGLFSSSSRTPRDRTLIEDKRKKKKEKEKEREREKERKKKKNKSPDDSTDDLSPDADGLPTVGSSHSLGHGPTTSGCLADPLSPQEGQSNHQSLSDVRRRSSSLRAAKDRLVLNLPRLGHSNQNRNGTAGTVVGGNGTVVTGTASGSPSGGSPTTASGTSPNMIKRLSMSMSMSLSVTRGNHSTAGSNLSTSSPTPFHAPVPPSPLTACSPQNSLMGYPSSLSASCRLPAVDKEKDNHKTESEKEKEKEKENLKKRARSTSKQRHSSMYNRLLTVIGQGSSSPDIAKATSLDNLSVIDRNPSPTPSHQPSRLIALKQSLPTSHSMPDVSDSGANSSDLETSTLRDSSSSSDLHLDLSNMSALLSPCDGFTIDTGSKIPVSSVFSKPNLSVLNQSADFPLYRERFFGRPQFTWAGPSELNLIIVSILAESDDFVFPYIVWTRTKNKYSQIECKKPTAKALMKELQKHNPFLKKATLHPIKDEKIYNNLVQLERTQIVCNYKFGVLYMKEGQVLEEEMFGNVETSKEYNEFLDLLGERITLHQWPKYRGGLDVKNNTTGIHSVYTEWEYYSIMFHVSTLLPYSQEDKQQIERKRHLGNDIVCIIFLEGDTPYNPTCISSEFIHVFIVVQPVISEDGETRYRVATASKLGVVPFHPHLAENALYTKNELFRELLLIKLINAERASYEATVFASKIRRTREQLIRNLVETFIPKSELK